MNNNIKYIQNFLLNWFHTSGRDLPWRRTYDPYHIWISEIMLQQTQMERGVAYFQRWIQHFPSIASVAAANEQEILKLWEGLGYYARARNLHAAAKIVVSRYDGCLPVERERLLELPGIGPYTAAAISSIAGNADVPVIDANVMRVYARLFDIAGEVKKQPAKGQIEAIAEKALPQGMARRYNQALMDFGSMICLPRSPLCRHCQLVNQCQAYANGTVSERPQPVAGKKTILIEMATGILSHEGKLFVQQRLQNDIWGGLWEFPGGRLEPGESPADAVVREYYEETGFQVEVCRSVTTVSHFYTRYKVVLHGFGCRMKSPMTEPKLTAAQAYSWVYPEELAKYGFPSGHRKILGYIEKNCPHLLADPCKEDLSV